MSARPLPHARLVVASVALTAVAALGMLAAARVPGARADSGPPLPSTAVSTPSISVPSLPVTVPTLPLPGTSTGTTPTPSGPAPGGGTGTTAAAAGDRVSPASGLSSNFASVAGAVRLRDGRISIPAGTVVWPLRLVMSRVRVVPAQVRAARQRLRCSVRVTDSRGYLVRGALVDVRSIPAGRIQRASALSGAEGSVTVSLQTTPLLSLRPGVLTLLFASYLPGGPRDGGTSARSLVRVPVRPVR